MDKVKLTQGLSKRLETQRIGVKLAFGIGTLLGLCIIIGVVSYTQTRIVSQKIEEITQVKEPINSAVYALENNLVETGFAVLGYLSQGDAEFLETFRRNESSFLQIQKKYAEVADADKRREVDTALTQGFSHFRAIADEQIALKNQQTETLEALLRKASEIDGILVGKIQASVKADDPLAFRRLKTALEMGVNANGMTKSLGSFLITGDPKFELRVYKAEQDFKRYFNDYQLLVLSSEEKEWAEQLKRLSEESLRLAGRSIDLKRMRMRKLAEFVEARRELDSLLIGQIQTRTEQGLTDAKHAVLLAGSRANTTILIVLLIALAFGTYTGILTTRNITGPLQQLVSVMNAIANGDYSRRADIKSSAELQSLSDSFNLMTGKLVRANADLRAEILERRRAEEAQKAAEHQMRMLAHTITSMNESVVISDSHNIIISVNPAFCATYGYEECEIVGKDLSILWPGGMFGEAHRPSAIFPGGWAGEVMNINKSGEAFPVLLSTSVVRDETAKPIALVTICRDITEQKRMQHQLDEAERRRSEDLRRFAVSVQRAQEDERQRISRELHDDVCQRLTGMKLRAEVLEDDVRPLNKKAFRGLRDFKKELDEMIVDVRRISSNLRPSVLDDFGLVTALRLLCTEFGKRYNIRAMFQIDDDARVDLASHIEIALYRIAQEALSNVTKHANALSVNVHLFRENSSITLIVEDDGRGFNKESLHRSQTPTHGLGLISMRERSELIGGTFEVDSGVGRGTRIRVTIPMKEERVYEED